MSDGANCKPETSGTETPETVVGPLNKGLGPMREAITSREIASRRWNLLHENLSLPTAVIYEDKLAHNLAWMQQFITANGVKLVCCPRDNW